MSRFLHGLHDKLSNSGFRKNSRIKWGIYAVLAILLYFIMIGAVLPQRFDFHVGDISPVDIRAPFDAVDTLATQKARQAVANKIPEQTTIDTTIEDDAVNQIDKLFNTLNQVITAKSLSNDQRLAKLKQVAPPRLSQADLQQYLSLTAEEAMVVHNESIRISEAILSKKLTEEDMQNPSSIVDNQLVYIDAAKQLRMMIRNLVLSVLKPNVLYLPDQTKQLRDQAMQNVPEQWINKGDLIVHRGQMIDQEKLSKLRDLKLLSQQPNYNLYFGLAGAILLVTAILAIYSEVTRTATSEDNHLLLLHALLILITTAFVRIVSLGQDFGLPSTSNYLVPVAMGGILVAVLLDTKLAIFSSFIFSLYTAILFNYRFELFFYSWISCLTGIYAVANVKQRYVFIRAAFIVAGSNILSIAAMQLLLFNTDNGWRTFGLETLFGVIGGLFAGILATGFSPFLESSFGLLTPISLLELSNPNHPLLKQLLMEAPGTYHHSLIVGNLAEAAAEAIGANALLCRVGAYYHDVGKMKRPMFFVENQMAKENPHDKIAPSLSHLIITSHVRDGVEMQEQHHLPKAIRDFAAQHHGTTVLWYFYNKALEQDKSGTVTLDDFRYEGPKPQTREIAIVMLCDAVEAAVRAMGRPTPQRVEATIHKIIKDRLSDGQLDECDLNFKDLDKIADAFKRTLNGIYHARIEYPDPAKTQKMTGNRQ
ncbi:HDIG domain-containing protein [Fodinisporobacter ferrooxydans]|uniref:HDIG domain-containing protein n=1 Tax=Fodinisporobacter ferrooxydans TaxID=2901836 RepID=A0ABY4CI62_9BACL|nr:HDIG domain-containing protein [Alicyclobacillaceae bacterium MYW30-H2]